MRPLLGIEAAEAALERIAVGHGDRRVDDRRVVEIGELDLDRGPARPAELVHAGIDQQPPEPRVESIGVAEPREITPGAGQRLLDGVLGPLVDPG